MLPFSFTNGLVFSYIVCSYIFASPLSGAVVILTSNLSFLLPVNATVFSARMNRLVFVYGTLKKGEPNHRFLSNAKGVAQYVANGILRESYPLVIASKYNIPFLLNNPGQGHRIRGEIYKVDEATMNDLDELEGYPDLYTREEKQVELPDRSMTVAWVYMLRSYDRKLQESATVPMEDYRSTGDHGRPYVSGEDCETYDDLFR